MEPTSDLDGNSYSAYWLSFYPLHNLANIQKTGKYLGLNSHFWIGILNKRLTILGNEITMHG